MHPIHQDETTTHMNIRFINIVININVQDDPYDARAALHQVDGIIEYVRS